METETTNQNGGSPSPSAAGYAAAEIVKKMREDTVARLIAFARAVEPFVADAACNDKFGWKKSRELYQECLNIRPLIFAAEQGEKDAANDLSEPHNARVSDGAQT